MWIEGWHALEFHVGRCAYVIRRWMRLYDFPKPIGKLGGPKEKKYLGWVKTEVDAWMQANETLLRPKRSTWYELPRQDVH